MGGRGVTGSVVSATLREALLRLATSVTSEPKGKVLFHHGDEARGLYLVCSGRVSVDLEPGSYAFPPRIAGPGAVLGLPATVAGSPYSLTAEVLDKAEVAFVPRDLVVKALATNQELCFEVMQLLSSEISGTRNALRIIGSSREHRA
ncbi:MAG TPA: Crp/Fnr family transcriptional regulator [Terriglobales bacterium]|nr:Crp/Fnr family transcriptional regulator [Terriglobales bacterium]